MLMYLADDYTTFGWKSKNDSTLTPNLEDFRRNGLYCKSGLAYEFEKDNAICVSTTKIMFN